MIELFKIDINSIHLMHWSKLLLWRVLDDTKCYYACCWWQPQVEFASLVSFINFFSKWLIIPQFRLIISHLCGQLNVAWIQLSIAVPLNLTWLPEKIRWWDVLSKCLDDPVAKEVKRELWRMKHKKQREKQDATTIGLNFKVSTSTCRFLP